MPRSGHFSANVRPMTRSVTPAKASRIVKKRAKSVDDASPYAKILAFAKNKKGKTVFGCSAGPKTFLVDIDEEGSRSAHGSGATVFEASSFDEAVWAYWYLKEGNHDHKVVTIDNLTTLHKAALRKVMGQAEERDPTREVGTASQREWGRANNLFNSLITDFRNLPMHVIFLAQERVIVDDDEDEPNFHTVDLPGGARGTALGCVGIIGRLYLEEVKKGKWEGRMLVGPHDEYDTGNRVDGLPRIIRNPTVPKLVKAWRANPPKEQ